MLELVKKNPKQKLKAEVVKWPCAYNLHLENPLETLRRLSVFFQEHSIIIERMQLHRNRNGSAIVILNCMIDKENVDEVQKLLSQIDGIVKFEKI